MSDIESVSKEEEVSRDVFDRTKEQRDFWRDLCKAQNVKIASLESDMKVLRDAWKTVQRVLNR